MKALALIVTILFTPHAEEEFAARLMALHEYWYRAIANSETENKYLELDNRKINHYALNNRTEQGTLLRIDYDSVGFYSIFIEGIFDKSDRKIFHKSSVKLVEEDSIKWSKTTCYFLNRKSGVIDNYTLWVDELPLTRIDTMELYQQEKTRTEASPRYREMILSMLEHKNQKN